MSLLNRFRSVAGPVVRAAQGASAGGQRQAVRFGGHHRVMNITPSRWSWRKTKDELHFYVMLTGIPIVITIFGVNIFIGPATLAEIPDGYEPEYWEYYKHPITRFLSRNLSFTPQKHYEKTMCHLQAEHEKTEMKKLETKVRTLMMQRGDYQGWYYAPMDSVKYAKRKLRDHEENVEGGERAGSSRF